MFSAFSGFFRYLFKKRSELDRLNFNDVLLTKLVLDIHRKKTGSRFEMIGLYCIEPVHPIDRGTAQASTRERVEALKKNREGILATRLVDRETLARFMPSISWIKAVQVNDGRYVSFEGNGRIEALRRVFGEKDAVKVEVEVYSFRNTKKIIRRIDRVRRHYGMKGAVLQTH